MDLIEEVRKALLDDTHAVVLKDTAWFIKHPLACRAIGGDCWVQHIVFATPKEVFDRLPRGTYKVEPSWGGGEGRLSIDAVEDGYDPMLTRLRELGVWDG